MSLTSLAPQNLFKRLCRPPDRPLISSVIALYSHMRQAKCLHCVGTACILRTQRLGYSPKNTCHLFTRGKTERCQYHRVGQVSIDTSGCSYNQQHSRRRTVRSWCRLATIEYRRSEPSSDGDHVDFFAVVDVAIPIDDLEHFGLTISLKSTKVLVHVLSVGKSTL